MYACLSVLQGDRGLPGERGFKGTKGDFGDPGTPGLAVSSFRHYKPSFVQRADSVNTKSHCTLVCFMSV